MSDKRHIGEDGGMNDYDRLVAEVERLEKERDAMALVVIERLTRERDEALEMAHDWSRRAGEAQGQLEASVQAEEEAQELAAELAEERTLVQTLWQAIREHRGAIRRTVSEIGIDPNDPLASVGSESDKRLWAAVPGLAEEPT